MKQFNFYCAYYCWPILALIFYIEQNLVGVVFSMLWIIIYQLRLKNDK